MCVVVKLFVERSAADATFLAGAEKLADGEVLADVAVKLALK